MSIATKYTRPGEYLRRTRMQLGLTTRDVAELSQAIAAQQDQEEFLISHARLVQVENDGSVPSIFKLFTLSAIYGVSLRELVAAYVDVDAASRIHVSMRHACTHLSEHDEICHERAVSDAIAAGPADTLERTSLMSHAVDGWARVPISVLDEGSQRRCRYGFIGFSDLTMYPLIRPGSFVQLDECQRPVPKSEYRTEFDRPIYFIETRSGYLCSWCEIVDGRLISIPHPLSPCRTRQFAFPSDAEIVGRVTGVAVRLTPLGATERPGARRPITIPVVGSTQRLSAALAADLGT